MPIYEYHCTSCGFRKEFLQKITDPVMSVCPKCNAKTFSKMVTAAGFQLKGSGWYATDFRNTGAKSPEKAGETAKADGKEAADAGSKETAKGGGKDLAKGESKSDAPSAGTSATPAGS
jgi:putative FmdB family regulatory protein